MVNGHLLVITGYKWDYTFYFDGVFLVLITGITRALTAGIHFHFDTMLRWGSPWIQNPCLWPCLGGIHIHWPCRFLGFYQQKWWLNGIWMVFRIINQNWLVVSIPLKNMKVSWDDYSQYMGKKYVPNHQPVYLDYFDVQQWIAWISLGMRKNRVLQVVPHT